MSRKISEGKDGEILIAKLDFGYSYGQIKQAKQTRNVCIIAVTGGEFLEYYRFLDGIYGLTDIPSIFIERTDKTLEIKHHAWQDDIIILTKVCRVKHGTKIEQTM